MCTWSKWEQYSFSSAWKELIRICCSGLITHLKFPLKSFVLSREAAKRVLKRAFLGDFCFFLLHPFTSVPTHSIWYFLSYWLISSLMVQLWLVSLVHYKILLFPTIRWLSSVLLPTSSWHSLMAAWSNCQFATLSAVFPGEALSPPE